MREKYGPRPIYALAAAFLIAAAPLASAQERGPGAGANRAEQRRSEAPATPRTPLPPESVTSHTITIGGGRTLAFTARAGAVRLVDANSGNPQADIAYVAFERSDAGDAATRPITFALNGGPGAASGFLDVGAMRSEERRVGKECRCRWRAER